MKSNAKQKYLVCKKCENIQKQQLFLSMQQKVWYLAIGQELAILIHRQFFYCLQKV